MQSGFGSAFNYIDARNWAAADFICMIAQSHKIDKLGWTLYSYHCPLMARIAEFLEDGKPFLRIYIKLMTISRDRKLVTVSGISRRFPSKSNIQPQLHSGSVDGSFLPWLVISAKNRGLGSVGRSKSRRLANCPEATKENNPEAWEAL